MQRRAFLQRTGITLDFVAMPGGLLRVVDAHACGEEGDVDLNAWVHVSNSENTISVKCPTSELGQGMYTMIPLLIAEELDADWRTIRVEQAPSGKVFINPENFNAQGVGGSPAVRGGRRSTGASRGWRGRRRAQSWSPTPRARGAWRRGHAPPNPTTWCMPRRGAS